MADRPNRMKAYWGFIFTLSISSAWGGQYITPDSPEFQKYAETARAVPEIAIPHPTKADTFLTSSAVFVSADGWFMTSYHGLLQRSYFIGNKVSFELAFPNQKPLSVTALIYIADSWLNGDYVLAKIVEPQGMKFPAVSVNMTKPNANDEVYSIGYPSAAQGQAVSTGKLIPLSKIEVERPVLEVISKAFPDACFFQMPSDPGSSGAPVFNLNNELVALTSGGFSDLVSENQSVSYGIPLSDAESYYRLSQYLSGEAQKNIKEFLDKIRSEKDQPDTALITLKELEKEYESVATLGGLISLFDELPGDVKTNPVKAEIYKVLFRWTFSEIGPEEFFQKISSQFPKDKLPSELREAPVLLKSYATQLKLFVMINSKAIQKLLDEEGASPAR